mmetsp:Transcript_103480/g.166833  ORF Transcript_103480/g.166833 Transcript_103480/m.166833 type:complete len:289 (+) Transcript_103480:918-1784(+)
MEQPKESKKAGKQLGKLIKAKEDEERAKAEAQILADQQVSLQRKIEESDFENAQDMFTSGSAGGAGGADSGKFESWPLTHSSKQKDVEEFAEYTAEKIIKFKGEFLYTSLLRKLLQETTKEVEPNDCKELLLVLTKGRSDFTVVDLVRLLLRDADKDVDADEIEALMQITSVDAKKKVPKGKEVAKLTARQMLLKLLLADFVRDTKPEDMGRIIEEACGVILTRDQQKNIATKRAEIQGDPNAKVPSGRGNGRVAEHSSLAMYDAFGSGGGEAWGGGGGTRGDEDDFM